MNAPQAPAGEVAFRGKSVFISHASKNFKIADQLCGLLEGQRVSCWIAPRDIPAGGQYGTEIVKAIRDCSIVVLVLTEEANRSKAVENEIERAFGYGKVIVPVRLRDIKPSQQLEFFVSNAQWVDAMESPLRTRVSEIINIVRAVEMHKPVSPPEPERRTLGGTLERSLERALRHKVLSAVTGFAILAALGLTTVALQAGMHADLGNATHAITSSAARIDVAASSLAGTGHAVSEIDHKLDKVKLETSSDPRKELANRGVLWTTSDYYNAVKTGDTQTVSLFMQGGMPMNAGVVVQAYEESNDATRELMLQQASAWPEDSCAFLVGRPSLVEKADDSKKAVFQRVCANPAGRRLVADRLAMMEKAHANAVAAYEQELKDRQTVEQCSRENLSPAGLQQLVRVAPVGARANREPGWGAGGPDPVRDMYVAVLDASNDTNQAHALQTIKTAVTKYCTYIANEKPNIDISDNAVQDYRAMSQWVN